MIIRFLINNFKKLFKEYFDKKLNLQAKNLSIKNIKKKRIKDLSEVEFQVFSQWGEDGIIDWIVSRISKIPKNFLEIGTQDYRESNTRFLLINKNWDGFLIEADKKDIKKIKSQRIYWKYNLKVRNEFITKENINNVVKKLKVPKKIGLLSLDIDGVDYWVLKELSAISPAIVICEFNSLFGLKNSVTVPYKKEFIRSKEHYSNLFYGASIKAFIDMMKKKNYLFLGTNSAGNNAFFLKKNLWKKITKGIRKKRIFRSKFRESRDIRGNLTYLDKNKSLELIKNKLIMDLKDKKEKKISKLNLIN